MDQTLTAADLAHKMDLIGFGIIITLFVISLAGMWHFFKRTEPMPSQITITHVIGAFIVFLSIPLVFVPLAMVPLHWYNKAADPHWTFLQISAVERGWLNLGVILGSFFALGLYSYIYRDIVRDMFDPYRKGLKWKIKQFGMGLVTCLVCLPLVLTVSQALDLWIDWQFNIPPVEQIAVVHLRSITEHYVLFGLSMIGVSVIVPIVEELLFRGYLQTWLAKQLGTLKAIILSSLFFALFHYASLQSLYNIQIVGSLFVLALFMGYIYARQQSLWASIALHMLFNFIGVSAIFFEQ